MERGSARDALQRKGVVACAGCGSAAAIDAAGRCAVVAAAARLGALFEKQVLRAALAHEHVRLLAAQAFAAAALWRPCIVVTNGGEPATLRC